MVASFTMLARRKVHLSREHVGHTLGFADGSTTRVYRETVVHADQPAEPCILVVAFRLRLVRGGGHRLFEVESLLNTPLFVGFPGFVSKLWCAHDDHDVYRGVYEWDGAERAEHYAGSLWRVLELVSVPGSIRYRVLPGLRRDDVLADPSRMQGAADDADRTDPKSTEPGRTDPDRTDVDRTDAGWWRLVGVT